MLFPLLCALFASLVLALPSQELVERASIQSPLNDPFYFAPKGWEDKKPGDVLRSRKVDLAFLQINKINYKEVYQVLYRTTGAYENEPAATVTTIIVPHNAQKNKLVNYLVYTDANGAKCAPSYSMRFGGYILTVPDYQGDQRGFASARLNGRQSLDGARAALNFDKVKLDQHAQVVTFGYSGGAIASGWAAALQPSYAGELNCAGFAMGGTPANLTSTVKALDNSFFSGMAVTGTTGLIYTHKKLLHWLEPKLTTKGRQAIEYARTHCMIDTLSHFLFKNFESERYVKGGENLFEEPIVQSVIGDLVLGLKESETPTAPVYIFHARHDEGIPLDDIQKSAKQWAKRGADVRFDEFTDIFCKHLTTELANIPNLLNWVKERYDNKKVKKGLHYRTIGNPLKELDRPIGTVTDKLVKTIFNFIGREIGPSDKKFREKVKNHDF